MPLAGIIPLNGHSALLALNQIGLGDFLGICRPLIRAKEPNRPTAKPFHHPGKSALVAIATFPVNELTGIATISFPYPEFVFFECK